MECALLCLQIIDPFLGSIDRELITNSEQYPSIALNGLVDICTLFTHCCRLASDGSNPTACIVMTMATGFCFNEEIECFSAARLLELKSVRARLIKFHWWKTGHSFEQL
jgi:hypothetical protein